MADRKPAADALHDADALARRLHHTHKTIRESGDGAAAGTFVESFNGLYDILMRDLFPAALELDDYTPPDNEDELIEALDHRQIVKAQDDWPSIRQTRERLGSGAADPSTVQAAMEPAERLVTIESRARTWIASRLSTSFGA